MPERFLVAFAEPPITFAISRCHESRMLSEPLSVGVAKLYLQARLQPLRPRKRRGRE